MTPLLHLAAHEALPKPKTLPLQKGDVWWNMLRIHTNTLVPETNIA